MLQFKDASHEKGIRAEGTEEMTCGARIAETAACDNTERVPHCRHRRLGWRTGGTGAVSEACSGGQGHGLCHRPASGGKQIESSLKKKCC